MAHILVVFSIANDSAIIFHEVLQKVFALLFITIFIANNPVMSQIKNLLSAAMCGCGTLFTAALCNREGHIYFHPVVCSSSSFFLSFFPRLISAVGDWMSAILPHMVWPYCKFRMQV